MMSSDDLITNRTYLLTARAKAVMDNTAIMLPGYCKTEVINTAIFLLGLEISKRRSEKGLTVKEAFESIHCDLRQMGYDEIISNLVPDRRSQTHLDAFLDCIDDDADAKEIIIGLMGIHDDGSPDSKEAGE